MIIHLISPMDDAAILAQRQLLREEQERLVAAKDEIAVQLDELPLTTEEQEKADARAKRKAVKVEQDRLAMERQDTLCALAICFFVSSTVLGIGLYLTGGFVTTRDKECSMWGPVLHWFMRGKDLPDQCGHGLFTAGIVFFVIGVSPCALAVAM